MGDYRLAKTKIILITDAWDPQVNGVVTTYKNIINHLPKDVSIDIIEPGQFKNIDFPLYKGIKLPFCSIKMMETLLIGKTKSYEKQLYDVYYHIATEGVLGYLAKRVLDSQGKKYTTAYHTKFPEFLKKIYNIPIIFTRWYFDWFHKNSKYVLCSSESNKQENCDWNSVVLDKGYDEHFRFYDKEITQIKTLLYVGRVSKEKNIETFCDLKIANTKKIVVGDGPAFKQLQKKYHDVEFVGYKFGEELASYYQQSDVFVFPSKVDTYGIVILEAMACGTPCAGYDVTGPKDQIVNGVNGYTGKDLEKSVILSFNLDRQKVYDTVKNKSWINSSIQFVGYVTKTTK